VEKILAHTAGENHGFAVTDEDRVLLEHLAVPLEEALAAAKSYRSQPCPLRDESLSLDFQGNVQLCCGIFDPRQFTLGQYLKMPIEDIQMVKENHPMCVHCMAYGIHRYLIYGVDGFAELALAHITDDDAKLINLQKEISQMRTRRLLTKMYDKFLARIFSARQKAELAEHFLRLEQRLTKRRKG
jgi:hypothetical protein